MKNIEKFLAAVYPGREWVFHFGGGLAGIKWLDGDAPSDLEQKWDEFDPDLTPVPTQEQIDAQRKTAYQAEADPLFFKWQRGDATEQEWLDKVAEIKLRYPDV